MEPVIILFAFVVAVTITVTILSVKKTTTHHQALRDCLCGGTIRLHKNQANIMGGAVCDNCDSSFNSGVVEWTKDELDAALRNRGSYERSDNERV